METIVLPTDIDTIKRGEFQDISDNPGIRFRTVSYIDPMWGDECKDYEFQIFKKPYFWGLVGKERWEMSIQTNSFKMGLGFSKHLLNKNKKTKKSS